MFQLTLGSIQNRTWDKGLHASSLFREVIARHSREGEGRVKQGRMEYTEEWITRWPPLSHLILDPTRTFCEAIEGTTKQSAQWMEKGVFTHHFPWHTGQVWHEMSTSSHFQLCSSVGMAGWVPVGYPAVAEKPQDRSWGEREVWCSWGYTVCSWSPQQGLELKGGQKRMWWVAHDKTCPALGTLWASICT